MNVPLTLLLGLPLLGAITIALGIRDAATVRRTALACTVLPLITASFMPLGDAVVLGLGVHVDELSFVFVLLTAYLLPVSLLATWNHQTHSYHSHVVCLLIAEVLLVLAFTAADLRLFYVAFEAVLIPMYIVIGLHGSSSLRLRAALMLFLYTVAGSFFLLMCIQYIVAVTGTGDMFILADLVPTMTPAVQRWLWLGIFISVMVKSPLVPLHLWLRLAHGQASLAGSILLAGVILKLATYLYLRTLIPMLPEACTYFMPLATTVILASLIHGSLATLRQVDTKEFIAYSSVGHMAIVMLGLAAGTPEGVAGAIVLSVAHGFISPALFVVVVTLYDRYHTRATAYIQGVGSYMPSLRLYFFIASMCSMAVPGSLNWAGELLCIKAAFEAVPVAGAVGCLSVILAGIYTIYFFNQLMGGAPAPYLTLVPDLVVRERLVLALLIGPALLLGLYPAPLLGTLGL